MRDLHTNIELLDSYLELKYNWNGNRASPFAENHINYVKGIILLVQEQPEIFPTAANSIHLEWDRGNNTFIIDIHDNYKINVFWRFGKKVNEYETTLKEALIQLEKYLNSCYVDEMFI